MIDLDKIGQDIIQEIDARLTSNNINNTNQASDSLKTETTETNLKIKGVGYIRFLDVGRKPGKFAPPEAIQDWVRTKLGITDEKEVRSVAFVINRKLAVEGNRMYIDKTQGLQLDEIVKLGIDMIRKEGGSDIIIGIKSEINKLFEGIK